MSSVTELDRRAEIMQFTRGEMYQIATRDTAAGRIAREALGLPVDRPIPPPAPRVTASFGIDARSHAEARREAADEHNARRDRTAASVERVNFDRLMRQRPTSR